MRRLSKFTVALSTAACLISGVGIASAAPGPPTEPAPGPGATPVPIPGKSTETEGRVIASADWGVGADGQPWFVVNKGQLIDAPAGAKQLPAKPPTDTARVAAAAGCHEEITEFELDGITEFSWFTEQICTGTFGVQDLSTQIRRSSWRGLLNYTNWSTYPEEPSPNPYISSYWTVGCNWEHGFYDYVGIIKGWAEGVGSGPTVRTENTIEQADCGPTAG